MRKIVSMTVVALFAFAAPAFAQEEEPGMDDPFGGFEGMEELVQKLEEALKPVLEQLRETIRQITEQFDEWIEKLDFSEMFGEFDFEQWMEKLREMIPGFAPGDEEDEEFLLAPC